MGNQASSEAPTEALAQEPPALPPDLPPKTSGVTSEARKSIKDNPFMRMDAGEAPLQSDTTSEILKPTAALPTAPVPSEPATPAGPSADEEAAATKLQSIQRGNTARKAQPAAAPAGPSADEEAAATKLQSIQRGNKTRKAQPAATPLAATGPLRNEAEDEVCRSCCQRRLVHPQSPCR